MVPIRNVLINLSRKFVSQTTSTLKKRRVISMIFNDTLFPVTFVRGLQRLTLYTVYSSHSVSQTIVMAYFFQYKGFKQITARLKEQI